MTLLAKLQLQRKLLTDHSFEMNGLLHHSLPQLSLTRIGICR